ncbi:MAG: DUF2357 domain-containing protein [Clostridia bacterium]|nr:DUF2357 domain-containing protein [Clostridia bacterium]
MNEFETYYRALTEYKNRIKSNAVCARYSKTVAKANPADSKIEVVKSECIIEEDWIAAIEKGLVHIEKALAEERQFIRSEGEVKPIEKVKQISKESVEHLARHGNLLTKKPESGADIIPDKLFTVERLTDYAVYENRFLYMLLCYLRDFVSYRYEKICELSFTYNGTLNIKKSVGSGDGNTEFEIKVTDVRRNDEYLKANSPVKEKTDRIDLILRTVLMFLSTPLMEAVAKSPKLKPPVTETNVLKMNKHFKGAKELYYFLCAYEKDGFTVERTVHALSPFSEDAAEDFAQAAALCAFLTYGYGNGLEGELRKSHEAQLAAERKEEREKLAARIKSLKRRINETGEGAEEYMLALERRISDLEADGAQLIEAQSEIKKLSADKDALHSEIEVLNAKISEQAEEALTLNQARADEIAEINAAHSERIESINLSHVGEIENINRKHVAEIEKLNEEIKRITYGLNAELSEKSNELSKAETQFEKARGEMQTQLDASAQEIEKLKLESALTQGKLKAVLCERGLIEKEEDFTAEVKFDELERQYKAFKAFFKEEWRMAKKRIRREILKPEKMQASATAQEVASEPQEKAADETNEDKVNEEVENEET